MLLASFREFIFPEASVGGRSCFTATVHVKTTTLDITKMFESIN